MCLNDKKNGVATENLDYSRKKTVLLIQLCFHFHRDMNTSKLLRTALKLELVTIR